MLLKHKTCQYKVKISKLILKNKTYNFKIRTHYKSDYLRYLFTLLLNWITKVLGFYNICGDICKILLGQNLFSKSDVEKIYFLCFFKLFVSF